MADISAIASDSTNLTVRSNPPVSTDFKFYAPAPVTESDDSVMSFSDFLDMVNPLQHIPLVSSAYRSITGDNINPASRIAGDALYGGILGIASAGIATLGAVVDEVFAASNDGKGIGSTVIAALFGDSKTSDTPTTQLADAAESTQTATTVAPDLIASTTLASAPMTPAAMTQASPDLLSSTSLPTSTAEIAAASPATTAAVASTATPNAQDPILVNTPSASSQAASSQTPSPQQGTLQLAQTQPLDKGITLDRSKPAYGGVMDTSMIQNAQQNQSLALALAGNDGIIKAQHALLNSRFMTSNPIPGSTAATASSPPPNASQNMIMERATATPTTASSPTATASSTKPTAETQAAMDGLLNDLKSMKGLDKYRNAAQSTPAPGSSVNTVN